jgi:hypothetical protein
MKLSDVAEFIRRGEFRGNEFAEQAAQVVEQAALEIGAAKVLAERAVGCPPGYTCGPGSSIACPPDKTRAECHLANAREEAQRREG